MKDASTQAWTKRLNEEMEKVSKLERELAETKAVAQDLHTSRAALALRLGRALNVVSELVDAEGKSADKVWHILEKAKNVMVKENEVTQ